MIFVSVVRDFAMYNRLVRDNPNNDGAKFVAFDNNIENMTIPARYNSFLVSLDCSNSEWIVFLHEDFQFLEPLGAKLPYMDTNAIYGVFGAKLRVPGVGLQIDSNKDGSDMSFRGAPVATETSVDTVDCACVMVHSSLIGKFGLRFDERLTYDLYTEDFGISARERFGVETKVLPIRSHHYSYGNVQSRFHEQLQYLNGKYSDASRVYVTTTCYAIGNASGLQAVTDLINSRHRIPRKWLFYRKVSHAGRVTVKVLGIPVVSLKKYSFTDWHSTVRT